MSFIQRDTAINLEMQNGAMRYEVRCVLIEQCNAPMYRYTADSVVHYIHVMSNNDFFIRVTEDGVA